MASSLCRRTLSKHDFKPLDERINRKDPTSRYIPLSQFTTTNMLDLHKPMIVFNYTPTLLNDLHVQPPGEAVRNAVYATMKPHARDSLVASLDPYCKLCWMTYKMSSFLRERLKAEAEQYLKAGGPRDYTWEKDFVKNYKDIEARIQRVAGEAHACDEWFKVITGKWPDYFQVALEGYNPAEHVMRLVETNNRKEPKPRVQERGYGDLGLDMGRSGEMDVSKTDIPAPPTTESILSPPATHVKVEKKADREEDKKTAEKKDESGVENS